MVISVCSVFSGPTGASSLRHILVCAWDGPQHRFSNVLFGADVWSAYRVDLRVQTPFTLGDLLSLPVRWTSDGISQSASDSIVEKLYDAHRAEPAGHR